MDNNEELKRMLTDMLKWFHNFCVEHELRYYILYGTMLGAARHEGFIPWDDDVDIGMPRKDYERLAQIMEKDSGNPRYLLEMPRNQADDYLYMFGKIYDTHTTLIENTRCKIRRGIYLDIFPLDGLGSSIRDAKRRMRKVDMASKVLLSRGTGIREGRSWWKNMAVIAARCIPELFLNNKWLQKRIDQMACMYDFDESEYVASMFGAYRYKEIMSSSIIGKPKLYKFENIFVYGVENFDEYLTNLYGDWKKLPPPDKRITHHDYIFCDLHNSYFD